MATQIPRLVTHLGELEVRRDDILDETMSKDPQNQSRHISIIRPCATPNLSQADHGSFHLAILVKRPSLILDGRFLVRQRVQTF